MFYSRFRFVIMGDNLEENYVLGEVSDREEVAPKPSRKRNIRELLSASAGSAEGQRQTFQEALPAVDAENFRFFDKDLAADSLVTSNSEIGNIFKKKTSKVLVLTSSAKRVADLSAVEFTSHRPLTLQFHGTGRKQEQLTKMRNEIQAGKFQTLVGVTARIARFVEEGVIDLQKYDLIAIDIAIDAKKFNTLSQQESKQALAEIFKAVSTSFTPNIVLF